MLSHNFFFFFINLLYIFFQLGGSKWDFEEGKSTDSEAGIIPEETELDDVNGPDVHSSKNQWLKNKLRIPSFLFPENIHLLRKHSKQVVIIIN